MIVIDTNVLSELMRPAPSPAVLAWAQSLPTGLPTTTAVTEAELRLGLALLPPGRRRSDLEAALRTMLDGLLAGRILPFDRDAAAEYAAYAAERARIGRPVQPADAMIVAIARARGARAIATRNLRDFEGCGLPLLDPWAGPAPATPPG